MSKFRIHVVVDADDLLCERFVKERPVHRIASLYAAEIPCVLSGLLRSEPLGTQLLRRACGLDRAFLRTAREGSAGRPLAGPQELAGGAGDKQAPTSTLLVSPLLTELPPREARRGGRVAPCVQCNPWLKAAGSPGPGRPVPQFHRNFSARAAAQRPARGPS